MSETSDFITCLPAIRTVTPVRRKRRGSPEPTIIRKPIWINGMNLTPSNPRNVDKHWKWKGRRGQFIYTREDRGGPSPLNACLILIAIYLLLVSAIFLSDAGNMSPEIFFHVEEPVTTDVTVTIPGGEVTATIPEVPMGRSATWEGVRIDTDGTLTFEGERYPFLYYEGTFGYEWSNQGWLLKKNGGQTLLNGEPATREEMIRFLGGEMRESGLHDQEIDVLLRRIIDLDMLDMGKPFMTIHYIPMRDVDKAIELSTSFDFTMMRRHFAFREHDHPVAMTEPEYEAVEDSGYLIHETAVNKF